MNENQSIRQEWETLLAAHRELVSAYLMALGTDCAPWVAQQARAITIRVGLLASLLELPLEGEPR